MNVKGHFAFFRRIVSKLTRRSARRIYIAIILILVFLTTAARLRSYLMARRIQAVLHGLAEIRIDQATEEQLLKTVPYLVRNENEWKVDGVVQRWYYAEISNESDWLMPRMMTSYAPRWLGLAAYWLGYRYMRFDAIVSVREGKVESIRYGLASQWARPVQASYLVSVSSAHGFWLPYQSQFEVTSQDDESPQYRAVGDDSRLSVTFTNDAPPERTRRAFQLNLSCFWSLRGCGDPPMDLNCSESKNGCVARARSRQRSGKTHSRSRRLPSSDCKQESVQTQLLRPECVTSRM